jgi:hypothetical protein
MPREFTFKGSIKKGGGWLDFMLYDCEDNNLSELVKEKKYKGKITIILHDIEDDIQKIKNYINKNKFYWNRANEDAINTDPLILFLCNEININVLERVSINTEYNASTGKQVILLRKLPKEWIE